METDWRPMQGSNPPAGVDPDWRAQLQPETRNRIVTRILETHLPASRPMGLNELQRNAVRFEEEIYTAATNQSDYWREICMTMLSMETMPEQAPGNSQVIPNQNNPGQASVDNSAQTGQAAVGNWQASNSNISQQRQPSQSSQKHYSRTDPQASLSTMSTRLQSSSASCIQHPTTKFSVPMHQNGAKRQRQTDSDLKAARRKAAQRTSFDSVRYSSIFDEWRLITAGEHWDDAGYSTADFGR